MSMVVITVKVHPDKYEKDFDAVVAFLTQYINKRAPILSVKVASFRTDLPRGKRPALPMALSKERLN